MMSADNSSEIIHLLNEINTNLNNINTKIDFCCGNYNKAAEDIQKVYRGHTSRRDTRRTKATEDIQKVYRGHTSRRNTRRTMRPNITESLFTMPKEVGDRINEASRQVMPRSGIIISEGRFKGQALEEALLTLYKQNYFPGIDLNWIIESKLPYSDEYYGSKGTYFFSRFDKWYKMNHLSDSVSEMPRSDIVVPMGKYKGEFLQDAFLGILYDEEGEYDKESLAQWTDSVGLRFTGADNFARKFKQWYDTYYFPKIGGKRKKKKTRKKKR